MIEAKADAHTLGRSGVVQTIRKHGKNIAAHINHCAFIQLNDAIDCFRPLFTLNADTIHSILKTYIIKVQFV